MKRSRQRNIGTVLAVVGFLAIPGSLVFLLTEGAESSTVQTVNALRHSGIAAAAGVLAGVGVGLVIASFLRLTDE